MKTFIKNISVGVLLALNFPGPLFSQTSNQNYIHREVAQQPVKTEANFSALNDLQDRYRSVVYFDGLGRTKQSIDVKATPFLKDMVSFNEYDQYGRTPREYLPYETDYTNDGSFRVNPVTEQDLYFDYLAVVDSPDRDFPFTDYVFEASPLDRVVERGASGQDWQIGQNHTVKTNFRANDPSIGIDYVQKWTFNPANDQFSHAGNFGFGELSVTEVEDENGSVIVEYKDKLGRVVLKRVKIDDNSVHTNPHTWANTYFFYDQKGNLRHVLQPEGVKEAQLSNWNIHTGNILNNFAFSYNYNGRNQIVEKKIPGAGWIYMVYDVLNRLVLTQDAAMRADNTKNWLFTKYDGQGRTRYKRPLYLPNFNYPKPTSGRCF